MKRVMITLAALLASTAAQAVQTPVTVHLNYGPGVNPGSAAYNGFTAAANYWSSVLTTTGATPVTVNFNVNFGHLPPNVLGSTRSTFTAKTAAGIITRLDGRRFGALDAGKVLPTLGASTTTGNPNGAVSVYTPGYTDNAARTGIDNSTKVYDTDGGYNNSIIGLTTANAKALGYTGAQIYSPTNTGQVDATIGFSSDFKFDFNPRNGITAGTSDFLAVAIHEFGHALGFVSGVDDYDYLGTGGPLADSPACGVPGGCKNYDANNDWFGETLDLFRYSATGALDWTTKTPSYFSVDGGATAYQAGLFSTGTFNGDGWQASHWKAPQVTLPNGSQVFSCRRPKLGVMNPYICNGRAGIVTALDLAAQDAIGWNITDKARVADYSKDTGQIAHDLTAVPEPASWALFIAGFGVVGAMQRRSRRSGYATA